jgi:hypothetical protein
MTKGFAITILSIVFLSNSIRGQENKDSTGIRVPAIVENGDTVALGYLNEINVFSKPVFENNRDARRFWRLVYNLKKVYPYAKLAGVKLKELNEHYVTLKTEKERKAYTKKVEDDIRAQYEEQLKELTNSQGHLLIKLIDRETGQTSYALVKELRGSISAMLWQTFARLFGYNLKTRYDPKGEDKLIEELIVAIDKGII